MQRLSTDVEGNEGLPAFCVFTDRKKTPGMKDQRKTRDGLTGNAASCKSDSHLQAIASFYPSQTLIQRLKALESKHRKHLNRQQKMFAIQWQ